MLDGINIARGHDKGGNEWSCLNNTSLSIWKPSSFVKFARIL